jgi:hypothetical protein
MRFMVCLYLAAAQMSGVATYYRGAYLHPGATIYYRGAARRYKNQRAPLAPPPRFVIISIRLVKMLSV